MSGRPSPPSPLAGVRVLDLSRLLPGPYLTRVLADLGADVVKVESPDGGDLVRHLPPFARGRSAAFTALNYGKRSLALDLKKPGGAELFLALARAADVVVESFRPGVLDRLGIGFEALAAVSPRLVLCSISGFGQRGPLAAAPGHDLGYAARAGVLSLFGPSRAAPQVPGVQLADIAGGAHTAAIGVLAALLERERTGRGRHLDVSMTRGVAGFGTMELARRQAGEREPRGEGLLTGGVPCYRVYRTADGRFMALAALEPKFFASFCARAGCEHLSGHGLTRGSEGEAVARELEAVFAARTRSEWVELLAGSESCCEPVLEPEEALDDPGAALSHVEVAGALALATDVGFGPQTAALEVARLGEHGAEVLRDFGVDAELVARARDSGAVSLTALEDGATREYP